MGTESLEFYLPWPYRELSPNARVHWAKRARFAELAKNEGYLRAYPLKMHARRDARFAVTLTFHPKDKRRYDLDNLIASMKAACDGICLGLGIDDAQFASVTGVWGERRKPAEVVVKLEVIG